MASRDFPAWCTKCARQVEGILGHSFTEHELKYCEVCKKFFDFVDKENKGQFYTHFNGKHSQTHSCCLKKRCLLPINPNGIKHEHFPSKL